MDRLERIRKRSISRRRMLEGSMAAQQAKEDLNVKNLAQELEEADTYATAKQRESSNEDTDADSETSYLQPDTVKKQAAQPRSPRSKIKPSLYRWGIKFGGSTSVIEFIEDIEDKRMTRGVSNEELIGGFSDLLEGTALRWYRTGKRKVMEGVKRDANTQVRRSKSPKIPHT